jgi:hypothetical protein
MKQRRDGAAGSELAELDDLLQHRARITVAVLLSRGTISCRSAA